MKKIVETSRNMKLTRSSTEIYKMLLKGKIKQFPPYFWEGDDGFNSAKEIVKFLIESVNNWTDEDIRANFSKQFIIDNRLQGMLLTLFKGSPYAVIEYVYPGRFKPWDFQQVPTKYWKNEENVINAMRWLIEEKLNWNDEQIKKNLSRSTFVKYGLSGLLSRRFKCSVYDAINTLYPGKFKYWEMKKSPVKWNEDNAREAVRWLIEDKLKWSIEDIKKNLKNEVFKKHGLGGMLDKVYCFSSFNAINSLYPGKIKPWELKYAPQRYWNNETAAIAAKWFIEEKLNWSYEDVVTKINSKIFIENGMGGLLNHMKNSVFLVLSNAYPDKDWSMLVSKYNK